MGALSSVAVRQFIYLSLPCPFSKPHVPGLKKVKVAHTRLPSVYRIPELIPILGNQPADDMNYKLDGRLPLLSARPAVTPATLDCFQFRCLVNRGTMSVNSLPKTVIRQRRVCNLNPGPSAPESSTLTTRLPSHPSLGCWALIEPKMKNRKTA